MRQRRSKAAAGMTAAEACQAEAAWSPVSQRRRVRAGESGRATHDPSRPTPAVYSFALTSSQFLVTYRAVEMPAAAAMAQEVSVLAGLSVRRVLIRATVVANALTHVSSSSGRRDTAAVKKFPFTNSGGWGHRAQAGTRVAVSGFGRIWSSAPRGGRDRFRCGRGLRGRGHPFGRRARR